MILQAAVLLECSELIAQVFAIVSVPFVIQTMERVQITNATEDGRECHIVKQVIHKAVGK